MESHVRHRDDHWIDACQIETTPRWKTSGLSGDEWRFGYTVKLWRKGHLLGQKSFGSMTYASAWLTTQMIAPAPAEWGWPDDAPGGSYGDGYYCDNPACAAVATWKGVLDKIYSRQGEGPLVKYSEKFRVFCDEHKHRGDCSREDADDNYTWTPIEVSAVAS